MDEENDIKMPDPSPQRKSHRKGLVIAAIIIGVVVALTIGFSIWHEQPSFCSAICHTPMGAYVDSYYSNDPGELSAVHEKAGVTCLDCHEARFSQQATEGMKWISGSYKTNPDGLLANMDKKTVGTREMCLRCHGSQWDTIVDSTSSWAGTQTVYNPSGTYNPHNNHRGDENCGDCHKAHQSSNLYCVECHNLTVPNGWNGFE